MPVTPSQRAFWQRQWAAEAEAREQRRRQLQEVAASVAEALREAMAVAETRSDALLIAADKAPLAVDLVRLEALPEPWQARIRRDGQRLA